LIFIEWKVEGGGPDDTSKKEGGKRTDGHCAQKQLNETLHGGAAPAVVLLVRQRKTKKKSCGGKTAERGIPPEKGKKDFRNVIERR